MAAEPGRAIGHSVEVIVVLFCVVSLGENVLNLLPTEAPLALEYLFIGSPWRRECDPKFPSRYRTPTSRLFCRVDL